MAGNVAGVILPTSINFTAISFEIFKIVSSGTALLLSTFRICFLFVAIMFFPVDVKEITPLLVEEGQFVKVTAEASAIKNNLLSHSNDRITFKAIPKILPEFVG